jgi:hypothetical protein
MVERFGQQVEDRTAVTPEDEGASMKWSWTAMAVGILAIFSTAGCNDYGSTFQGNTGAVLTFLSPSLTAAGSGDLTLTVNSTGGFVSQTVVQWNGKTLPGTTVVNGGVATVVVPAAMLKTPGKAFVNTLNPHSGSQNNGLSNTIAFTVYGPPNPAPTVSSISPTTAAACGTSCSNASVKLTIQGSNFLPTSNNGGSTVTWTVVGSAQAVGLAVTSLSPTQITATIDGSLLAADATVNVNVVNPPSFNCLVNCPPVGGGPSPTPQPFTVGKGSAAAKGAARGAMEETPAVSSDGRYVAYTALQDEHAQVFLRDTCTGANVDCQPHTSLISAASETQAGNGDSRTPAMSADGRFVAFSSEATNLVPGGQPGRQIYLRDTCIGADAGCKAGSQLVSTDPNGALVGTENILPSISASGRFVAFLAVTASHAATAAAGQAKSASEGLNSGLRQVFVRDTCLGAANCTPKTTRISMQPGDTPANEATPAGPAISGGAKRVALADGKLATLFTRGIAVDDQVVLAASGDQHETK